MMTLYIVGGSIAVALAALGGAFLFGSHTGTAGVEDKLLKAQQRDTEASDAARRDVDGLAPGAVDQRLQPWARK